MPDNTLRTAMRNVDEAYATERPAPRATPDPYALQRERDTRAVAAREEAKAKQIEKIKHRPTERLTAYSRGAEKMIEEAREELLSMEAEHALMIDAIATEGQNKIDAKRSELQKFEAEVERCRAELAAIEKDGTERIEAAVAEYQRQRTAQEAIIKAQLALRDSLNPAITAAHTGV